MEPGTTQPARRSRVILVIAGLVVLVLVTAGSLAWWRGRAVTIDAMQRTLAGQPETYEDIKDRLGMVAATDMYFTMVQDKPEIVRGYADHPDFAGKIHWFEGRGGRAALTHVQFADALDDPWQHSEMIAGALDEGTVTRSYCIYMNSDGRILGWADVTGGPGLVDVFQWSRASGSGKHPHAKRAE